MNGQAQFFACHDDQSALTSNEPRDPFFEAAHHYHNAEIAVIPCLGGNEGKVSCVKWNAYKNELPTSKQVQAWQNQFPNANIGLVTGAVSGITVVDIDTGRPETIQEIIQHFGDTPVKVQTPSGGLHLYYSYNNEGSHTRVNNWPVDIRADGGYIIAPPSINPATGFSYRFSEGNISKLHKLPQLKSGSLPKANNDRVKPDLLKGDFVPEGQRNSRLFEALIHRAKDCTCYSDMEDTAYLLNDLFMQPPMQSDEVEQVLNNVWRLKVSNQIYGGGERFITTISDEVYNLQDQPRAFWLLMYLKDAHTRRREQFAISPKAIAQKTGWDCDTVRHARKVLLERRYIECVYKGGKQPGDVSLFRFNQGAEKPPQL